MEKIARITSEFGLLFLCLFFISALIGFILGSLGWVDTETFGMVAFNLIYCSLAVSLFSLICFATICIMTMNIPNSILGENAQYSFFAFISFLISLSFIILPFDS